MLTSLNRVTRKPRDRSHQIFCACCLWSWLGPPLTALRYVVYFRFCGWRQVCSWAAIEHDKQSSRDSKQILLNDNDWKCSLWVAHRGQSHLSTIALMRMNLPRVTFKWYTHHALISLLHFHLTHWMFVFCRLFMLNGTCAFCRLFKVLGVENEMIAKVKWKGSADIAGLEKVS